MLFPGEGTFIRIFCVDDREIAAMEAAFAAFQAAPKGGEVQVVTVDLYFRHF